MKQVVYEFSRPLQVDRVPALGCHERLAADEKECAALAKRLGLPKIHSLGGLLKAVPWRGGGLKITGTLNAEGGSGLRHQPGNLHLRRLSTPSSATSCRRGPEIRHLKKMSISLNMAVVDLGEILAETMALELDPYPRQAGEVFNDIEEQPEPAKVSPFTGLSKLKH